ncbi:MAG TPA: phosphoadenylyl-sulfate reductase, partial [Hyphomicrobiales bacterium]|nr:phosphoadenylyl-sulfate reductase [Hyphomicrobiales bacterium]
KSYGELSGAELLKPMIEKVFPGRIALVSSFGAESAVLAHMVAEIDPATPIVFVDTGRLFPETLAYRDHLVARLGLSNVNIVSPSRRVEERLDPDRALYATDPDGCCGFRKIEPMERGLRGYQAWITGRKRFHGGDRSRLPALEPADWRLKVNPLASWTPEDIAAYFDAHDLPRHPLTGAGYLSIGCSPCTTPVADGEAPRAGRWRGREKTECGIHWTVNGRPLRALSGAQAG